MDLLGIFYEFSPRFNGGRGSKPGGFSQRRIVVGIGLEALGRHETE
jgi:hypothetical protein